MSAVREASVTAKVVFREKIYILVRAIVVKLDTLYGIPQKRSLIYSRPEHRYNNICKYTHQEETWKDICMIMWDCHAGICRSHPRQQMTEYSSHQKNKEDTIVWSSFSSYHADPSNNN
jgi:hypothetical protein